MSHFRGFVILGTMRTGSNFLEASLSDMPSLSCHGELFNPAFIGGLNKSEFMGFDLAAREADPLALLTKLLAEQDTLPGFRLFNGHDPRVLEAVLDDPTIGKIILTRNLPDCYLSLRHANVTGQWKAGDFNRIRTAKVQIDREAYESWRASITEYYRMLSDTLRRSGQTPYMIDYSELHDLALINGIAAWLGIPDELKRVSNRTKKQIVAPPEEMIENWDEVADIFAGASGPSDIYRASGPGVVRYLAAKGVPLLYMPIRHGTGHDMADWFEGFGKVKSFNHKSLRNWREATAGARSFTIVRHPVDRLIGLYFSDLRDDIRDTMARRYGVRFSPDPTPEDLTTFARIIRASANAQTSLRAPPDWAPQSDNIRDLSQLAPPDYVLRDEQLENALSGLCQTLGVDMPDLFAPDDFSHLHSAELDAEVRELWAKDYLNFGYAALSR